MDLTSLFLTLGISLGLGLLVGLQREHVSARLGGIRTFPLVTILGSVCGLMAASFGGWIIAAGLLAVASLIILGNIIELRSGTRDPGLTTEIAMLLMFAVGAYLTIGSREIAIAVGSGVAILLQFKGELHGIARRLGKDDLRAMMQFALISFIILPILPNRTYGPFDVLNPRKTWFMVVLIVGISLSGYVAYKFLGARAGLILGGVLGGLISSTATTVSYARRSKTTPSLASVGALIIVIASTILYLRILAEIAAVAPHFVWTAAPPIIALVLLLVLGAAGLWYLARDEKDTLPPQGNPSELKAALVFALIYSAVLFAVAAVKENFGDRGLFVVAILSGLTDVDAITLSVSELVGSSRVDAATGWRLIVSASLSNLVFKSAIVVALGDRLLLKKILAPFLLVFAGGVAILLFWPG